MNIEKSLDALEQLVPHYLLRNEKVSSTTVAWHIDHSLKVINSVCEALKKSNPENYKGTSSFVKFYIFLTGNIPKGKAKAPKHVVENGEISKIALENQLEISKKHLQEIKILSAKNHFSHPYFGMLPLKKSQRFLAIHTKHHLKIINEIINSNK
ncbi:hypothetical protein BX611_2460 [Lutibacter oceani]|uniref:DinB family protein n=1 Tax=Lutibacter oceani TaxID=1853311 RepID=A0A3D9RVU9_9FLAO|nr:hypothetical protein [Lutibacter oceani]REE80805.1 hypothetical protein BX611_2460 [Lutibacter oceani]